MKQVRSARESFPGTSWQLNIKHRTRVGSKFDVGCSNVDRFSSWSERLRWREGPVESDRAVCGGRVDHLGFGGGQDQVGEVEPVSQVG